MSETLFVRNDTPGLNSPGNTRITTGENNTTRNDRDDVNNENALGLFSFSLTNAIQALETRAAQSLDIFGGAPTNNNALLQSEEQAQNNRAAQISTEDVEQPGSTTRNNSVNPQTNSLTNERNAQAAPATPGPAIAQLEQISQTVQSSNVHANNIAPLASNISPSQPVRTTPQSGQQNQSVQNTLSTRATQSQSIPRGSLTPTANAQTTPTSTITQESFARLVTSRLASGDNRFEVRLDPPELGRVEIRLDSGEKTKLNLEFDQQSTLDLFRRDEQALRSLLSDAGLNDPDLQNPSVLEISFQLADGETKSQQGNQFSETVYQQSQDISLQGFDNSAFNNTDPTVSASLLPFSQQQFINPRDLVSALEQRPTINVEA